MTSENLADVFTKNLTTLTINYSDTLTPNNSTNCITLLESKNSLPTAMYKNKLLHSKYDPTKEDDILIETTRNGSFDCIIVLEMGLGYIVDRLYEKFVDVPIIIIELDLELSLQLLGCINYSTQESIVESTIFIAPNNQLIIDFLYNNNLHKPLLLCTQAAKNMYDTTQIQEKVEAINEYSTKATININTLNKFRHKWTTNTLINLTNIPNPIYSLEFLADRYKGLPSLLCAAGSSIEEIIPYFSELSTRLPIICVDTVLGLLHQLDIVPDIVVSVDPQYINSTHLHWHLQWAIEKGSVLVLDLTTCSRTAHLLPSHVPIFTYETTFILGRKLCNNITLQKEIISGGSVATIAWEICRVLGSKEIYTAGLDLSFASNRSHCKQTIYENKNYRENTRLSTMDTKLFKSIVFTQHKQITQSCENKPLISNLQFFVYKSWFENQLEKYKDISCYTLSKNTIKIKNVEFASINSLLLLPICKPQIANIYKEDIASYQPIDKRRILRNLLGIMEDLLNTQEAFKLLSKNIYNYSIENSIAQIHELFANSKSIEIIQFLYQENIPNFINKINLPSKTNAQLDWLAKLYRNIYIYLENTIQLIEMSCNNLNKILERSEETIEESVMEQ